MEVGFTPDDHVRVHPEGAIRQICAMFRSHEDGLPEWIKNSSDAYARFDSPPADSVIVVFFKDGRPNAPALVGCLDFGGMTVEDVEGKFRQWADPSAAGQNEGVQGGHGNGGKCYMTQMFSERAYLHSVQGQLGNTYGFNGGRSTPGYFPSVAGGRNFTVTDVRAELDRALQALDLTSAVLPTEALQAFERRRAFSLVLGIGAKSLGRGSRIPVKAWIESLSGHPQMVSPLQRTKVFVIHNGRQVPSAAPLMLPAIEPIPGADAPRVISVPDLLVDPSTGEEIETNSQAGVSRLELKTSNKSMRWSAKSRHTIVGWTHDKHTTGFWEVPYLSTAPYANKIYGEVFLDELGHHRQNDRRNHSDAPLTRALKSWIANQIDTYSAEFEELDRLQASREQKNELSRLNDRLNKWKNSFLAQEFGGVGESRRGTGKDDTPRPVLPRGTVAQVVLGLSHQMAGCGVSFRPSVDFFDSTGGRVRPVPHVWTSSDTSILNYDSDLGMLVSGKCGKCFISVECKDTGVNSNSLEIEILDIKSIDLSPTELKIATGSRHPILAKVETKDGRIVEGVYLIWTENDRSIISVGSSGMVFGLSPGKTEVTAGDDSGTASVPAKIEITGRENAGQSGDGFPRILLSEIDIDPLGEAAPAFSSADPPVYQRPQDVDANIWWINMSSPLARRYIDTARGGGANSREWRVYLLERYIEIMVKIVLTYDFTQGEQLSFETMLRRWEEESTNMQQRAADSLAGFLDGGDVALEAA